jgi:hypothetical protein
LGKRRKATTALPTVEIEYSSRYTINYYESAATLNIYEQYKVNKYNDPVPFEGKVYSNLMVNGQQYPLGEPLTGEGSRSQSITFYGPNSSPETKSVWIKLVVEMDEIWPVHDYKYVFNP